MCQYVYLVLLISSKLLLAREKRRSRSPRNDLNLLRLRVPRIRHYPVNFRHYPVKKKSKSQLLFTHLFITGYITHIWVFHLVLILRKLSDCITRLIGWRIRGLLYLFRQDKPANRNTLDFFCFLLSTLRQVIDLAPSKNLFAV